MPYPNEHAARVRDPDDFETGSMRSKDLKDGVRLILGKLKGETAMTVQAYRFDKTKFTPEQAKKWLKDNDVKSISFEPASESKESKSKILAALEQLSEKANMGDNLEARFHSMIVSGINEVFAGGYITREERDVLLSSAGEAMSGFAQSVAANIPGLLQRAPWDEAAPTDKTVKEPVSESLLQEPADVQACVRKIMNQGHDQESALYVCNAALEKKPKPAGVSKLVYKLAQESFDESVDWETEYVPLLEKAVRTDGSIPIKIIQSGWGSSGYYPPEVLERDGPKVFKAGLKMFWNHPTLAEETERPEGSLDNLAAELISNAVWKPNAPTGAGLYADAKVFEIFKSAVDELAPHIGVSIRAEGQKQMGKAEGQAGPIIQAITAARSIDFVTSPGAGGQVLQLFESRRSDAGQSIKPENKEIDVMDEVKELKEANALLAQQVAEKDKAFSDQADTLAKLQSMSVIREAGELVSLELAKTDLPDSTKARISRDASKAPPVKEGLLDKETLMTNLAEAIKVEREYLASIGQGKITGMGSGEPSSAEAHKALVEAFVRTGLSEEAAEIAASGR